MKKYFTIEKIGTAIADIITASVWMMILATLVNITYQRFSTRFHWVQLTWGDIILLLVTLKVIILEMTPEEKP